MHADVDLEPCGYDPYAGHESKIMVEELMKKLDSDEREIIELFYFSEKTAKEISKMKSISETRVFYLKSRAIEKMRNGIQ